MTKKQKQTQKRMHITLFLVSALAYAVIGFYGREVHYELPEVIVPKAEAAVEEVKPLSVEEQIRAIAKEEGFKWENYLVRLADCESKLGLYKSNDKGNTPAGSIDRGVFMINNYWHKEVSDECAYDVDCATRWTINMINKGRQHEWVCDKLI
jgi:hypothetical protein